MFEPTITLEPPLLQSHPSFKSLLNWLSQLQSYQHLNTHHFSLSSALKQSRSCPSAPTPQQSQTILNLSAQALSLLLPIVQTDKKVEYLDRCEISHDVLQYMDQMTDTISIIECVATVRDRQTLKKKSKSEAWVMLIPHLQQYAHLKKLSICSSVIDIRAVYSICLYLPHIVKLHLPKNNVQDKGAELIARHLLDLQILSLWSNSLTDVAARSLARGLTHLKELNIGMNNITSDGIVCLASKRPNLSVFVIFGNNFDTMAEMLVRSIVSPTTQFVF